MRLLRSTRTPRLFTGAVAVFAATALVLTAAPASAGDPRTESPPTASAADLTSAGGGAHVDGDRPTGAGQAAVRAALQRDLGLTRAEVTTMLDTAASVDELNDRLQGELGSAYGGSWFDHEAGALVVATTDADAARTAREAGAQTRLVTRSAQELDAIHDELDARADTDPQALAGALAWTVDVRTNQVVVTVAAGEADGIAPLAEPYGDAVRIEQTQAELGQLSHDGSWLDGGVQYVNTSGGWSCSVGFNVRNPDTGARYFLTAGHCGDQGQQTSHGGTSIGPFVESWFPGVDDAIVRVDNSSWSMGPYVWTYPGVVSIGGARSSAIGTPVCKSGMTTQLTCGTITNKNVTVNYPEGAVHGLGQHDACAEPGDSGGSTFSTSGGNFAEGLTSGGQMIGGLCLEKFGMQNVTYYQEVTDSLAYYGPRYGIQLW